MITEKPCSNCNQVKPLDDFARNRKGLAGRQAQCRSCVSEKYYVPRKQKLIDAKRQFRSTDEGRQKEREWTNARRRNNPLTRIIRESRARAKLKGIPFDIKEGDLFIPMFCPVLGIPIGMGSGPRSDGSLSIDRIDNSKGYVRGNVRIISWRANRLKSDATLGELQTIVRYMQSALAVGVTALNMKEAA